MYGFPSEHWEVNLPAEEVPPELPEPVLGINFARDGMQEKDWLSLVAVHSDAWLLAIAFYFGARFGFDKADRYFISYTDYKSNPWLARKEVDLTLVQFFFFVLYSSMYSWFTFLM